MGRMYVESTPASRGEVEPEVYEAALSQEELEAAAAAAGFVLVPAEDAEEVEAAGVTVTIEVEEPAGNATTESWVEYARARGATPEDLEDMGRDEIRTKYGSLPPAGD